MSRSVSSAGRLKRGVTLAAGEFRNGVRPARLLRLAVVEQLLSGVASIDTLFALGVEGGVGSEAPISGS